MTKNYDWRKAEMGTVLYFNSDDFDVPVPYSRKLVVLSKSEDHIIAVSNENIVFWVDDNMADMFSEKPKYRIV